MKIGIIGLGLIGGSAGRALCKRTAHEVYAFDTDPAAMLKGEMLEAYHQPLTEENASELDLLLIALYPAKTVWALEHYVPLLKEGCIVADFAGVKRKPVAEMQKLAVRYPGIYLIGAHPMAGREFSGISHSTPGLFDRATMPIVNVNAPIDALHRFRSVCLEIGFDGIVPTSAEEHDRVIAYTSQLAHIVSAAYVVNPIALRHHGYSAGSFRDMTRVAKLNPGMWTELFSDNRDNLIEAVKMIEDALREYRLALESDDKDRLFALLDRANRTKEAVEADAKRKKQEAIYDND